MGFKGFSIMLAFGKPVMPNAQYLTGGMIRLAIGPVALWIGIRDLDDLIGTMQSNQDRMREELETLQYNYSLREADIRTLNDNNHDEKKWTYWRKRSGQLLGDWSDLKAENEKLRNQLESSKFTRTCECGSFSCNGNH